MANQQLAALEAIDRVIAAYPPAVQAHVLEGVVVAALEALNGVDASRWLASQQDALDLLPLRETRALLDRVTAAYTDYGVRVGDLVAEC